MLFSQFSLYLKQIENTSSRLEMTRLLALLLKEASLEEVGPICYMVLGQLGPLYDNKEFNIGTKLAVEALSLASNKMPKEVEKEYKRLGDLGDVAFRFLAGNQEEKRLSLNEVFSSLSSIAAQEGTGSQERKVSSLSQLLLCVDPLSAKYIIRIPMGALRLGFSDLTILDALSWMLDSTKKNRVDIERAYNIYPNIEEIVVLVKEGGLKGLSKIRAKVGVPILCAKAQRLNDPEEIFAKMGSPLLVEPKLDGTRLQVHISKKRKLISVKTVSQTELFSNNALTDLSFTGHIRLFSRNLEDMTAMFPDLCAGLWQQINVEEAVFDGEVLGIDSKTGAYVPFQQMITRKRKHGIANTASALPVRLVVFDLLYLDGKSLLAEPFTQRRKLLGEVVSLGAFVKVIEQKEVSSSTYLAKEFSKAKKEGLEGLMVKIPSGEYQAGARGFNWVKLKTELDSLDAVIMGYYSGRGKRSGFGIGAFLVGLYDIDLQKFVSIAKIGTGLSDTQWVALKKRCDEIKVQGKPAQYLVNESLYPDVWVAPKEVVVIRSDEITKSPLHTASWNKDTGSGLALRFPRIIDFRHDKSVYQITTVGELKDIFFKQKQL